MHDSFRYDLCMHLGNNKYIWLDPQTSTYKNINVPHAGVTTGKTMFERDSTVEPTSTAYTDILLIY